MTFRPGESRAVPGGVLELSPDADLDALVVDPGTKRTIDLFFPLPGTDRLPNAALGEIELSWLVEAADLRHRSKATFQIARGARYWHGPYYYYPAGPYVGGWYGRYYWRGPRYHYFWCD